jgi:hypothetical protein
MKNRKTTAVLCRSAVVMFLLVIFCGSTAICDYKLSWYTIDGGGGRSSGGQYELLSTIGQPDAAWSSGGDYELLGGFLPGGPLCFVDFESFAKFANYWRDEGVGIPADLHVDVDNIVNKLDLRVFVDLWLCYCPGDWPL